MLTSKLCCNTVSATSDLGYAYINDNACSSYAENYRTLLDKKDEEISNLEQKIKMLKATKSTSKIPEISKIEMPKENKVIIVYFTDGTKEKAVCDKDDQFSFETGIEVCVMKKMMGGNAAYNKYIKNAVKHYNEDIERNKKEKEAEERKMAKIQKEKERKQRRRERKIAEEVNIYKKALIEALKELNID